MTVEEALQNERIGNLPLAHPTCVRTGTSLGETLRIMREEAAGAVLVCDGTRLVGIFTERDVLNKVFRPDLDEAWAVDRFMTRDPEVLSLEDRLGEAVRLMTEGGYRHIPLLDKERKRAGMIAAKDIVKYIAEHFPAEVVNLPPSLEQQFSTPDGA